MRLRAVALAVVMAVSPAVTPAAAQDVGIVQSEILVLDVERLFEETRLGQRMTADHQAQREQLAARNRKLEAELEAEEQRLTDIRSETAPEDFRELADAFDEKVQEIRRDSERRALDLERDRELLPRVFLRTVEQALFEVMRDAGGVVVLDARTVIFRADAIDITDAAIARIDETIGEGAPETPAPPEPAE